MPLTTELEAKAQDVRTLMQRYPFDESSIVTEPSWIMTLYWNGPIYHAIGPAAAEIWGWLPRGTCHHEQSVVRHEIAFVASELPTVLERAKAKGYCVAIR